MLYLATMMSTVEYLWNQKSSHEEKISNAEFAIDDLNNHVQELGVFYVKLRTKTKPSKER